MGLEVTAPSYGQREAGIKQRLLIAKMLSDNAAANEPNPNAIVGNKVVPISPFTAIANALSKGVASYQGAKAQTEQGQLEDDKRNYLVKALSGGGQITPEIIANAGGNADDLLKMAIAQKATTPDPWKNVPIGFKPNPDGTIVPMVDSSTGKPYSEIQLERAIAAKQIPGYGQQEANARAEQSLNLQQQSEARQQVQQDRNYQLEQEKLMRQEQNRQEELQRQEQNRIESRLQNIPATHRMAYVNNAAEIAKIDAAIESVRKNPDAFGLKNMLGDTLSQRIDPEGVDPRSKIGDIGSVRRHELTGATMSAKEAPTLAPSIPSVNDTAKALIDKLTNLKKWISEVNTNVETMYSDPGEYRNPIQKMVNPTGVPSSAQFNGKVSNFRLTEKAAKLSPIHQDSLKHILATGTDQEKIKLLNGGLLEEVK